MGASRIGNIGSSTTLGILTVVIAACYLVTVTFVAIWWSKEERKLSNKTVARLERQLETCKRNNNE
jgi:preprotein translocase subunit SecG